MSNNIIDDYNKWSLIYDNNFNPTRDLDKSILIKLLPDITNKVILEAGCGTGKNTQYFAQYAKSVLAFDLSPGMLNIAKSKVTNSNVTFLEHDILTSWPANDYSIDIVSINLVLEHIENIDFVFHESYRVLKTSGKLCICEFHPQRQLLGSKTRFKDPVSKEIIFLKSYFHDKDDFTKAGNKIGFKVLSTNDWFDDSLNQITPRIVSIIFVK